MTTLNFILLDGATGGGPQGGIGSLLMIVAMIAIFYFIMIRPQTKKQKELKKQREAMKKGDRVVTSGGIHGKIRNIKDNTVMVEVAPGMELEVDKASVFPVEPVATKDDKSKKDDKSDKSENSKKEDKSGKSDDKKNSEEA